MCKWLFRAIVWIQVDLDHFTMLWSSGQCYQTWCWLTSWPWYFSHAQFLLSFLHTGSQVVGVSLLSTMQRCVRGKEVCLRKKAFEALESRMPLRGAQYPVWGSVDCFLLPSLPCPQCPLPFLLCQELDLHYAPKDGIRFVWHKIQISRPMYRFRHRPIKRIQTVDFVA